MRVSKPGFITRLTKPSGVACSSDLSPYRKLDEEPYDFVRKRLSVLVATPTAHLLVTKGALANVLAVCSTAEAADGTMVELAAVRDAIESQMAQWSGQGLRVLGLASRELGVREGMTKDDESDMTFWDSWCSKIPSRPMSWRRLAASRAWASP